MNYIRCFADYILKIQLFSLFFHIADKIRYNAPVQFIQIFRSVFVWIAGFSVS
ncbi:MAG: hypothetical protein FWE67_00180 [Planctomycetaceae bacterium]|nr:hypothetical protein [Planctomycetaceae bacterium]